MIRLKKDLRRMLTTVLSTVAALIVFSPTWSQQPNFPPTVEQLPTQSVTVGEKLIVPIKATDPNAIDTLTIHLISAPPTGSTFSDHGGGTATLTWQPALNQAGTYRVRVIATDNGAPSITSSPMEFDIVVNNTPKADLAVDVLAPTEALTGDKISISITVENRGESPATNVTLVDNLSGPEQTSFTGQHSLNQGNCRIAGVTQQFICDIGTLNPGSNVSVSVEVFVGFEAGDLLNQVSVGSEVFDPDRINNNASETTIVKRRKVDLAIKKTANKSMAQIGDIIRYTLEVNLLNHDAVESTIVDDVLPSGMTIAKILHPECVQSAPNKLRCDLDSITNKSATIQYDAQANVAGELTNMAEVIGLFDDPDLMNNKHSHTVVVEPSETTKVRVTIGGTTPVSPTGTITNPNKSEIPVRIIVDGEEKEATTDENGQADFEMGNQPQKISVSTVISPSNESTTDVTIDLNKMPPTGNLQINSSQSFTSTISLNTDDGATAQLSPLGADFSWQNRFDVNTASISLKLSQPSSAGVSSAALPNPVEIELVIDAVWEERLYLPVLQLTNSSARSLLER